MARVCPTGRYALSLSVLTCVTLWCAAGVRPLAAQHREGSERRILRSEDPALPDFDPAAARRAGGFRLFALADAAGTGIRQHGNFSFATDNYSPCDAPLSGFCNWRVLTPTSGPRGWFQFFEVLYYAGVPPSEWANIARVAPSVRNAKGGGFSTHMNFALFAGRAEWGPRDGTLGQLFAGVASTTDGSCRDYTRFAHGDFPDGLPLLAGSDCSATWPATGWTGDRAIPGSAWETRFRELGTRFRFDYWQVPDSLKVEGFLGSGFHTYGESSDHYAEILADYGAVIPGSAGEPRFQGYPLGLVWRFEAFTFDEPGLDAVVFWRGTVINRSADVYGGGVDYDSLYLGFSDGADVSVGEISKYYRPDLSMLLVHSTGVQGAGGPCGDPSRSAAPGIVGCFLGPAAGYGYYGASAIVVLKSPIGDQRNKLFTRRADGTACTAGVDPFCDRSHPLAGDTITFNHGHMCGFGGCWAGTHNVSDKRSFGMISSTEANVIDGQTLTPSSFTWRTFRTIGYPQVMGRFNKYVPGIQGPPAAAWDWNHDGVADTLFYDSCGPSGCVVLDSDTMPGGQINAYANVGSVLSAGPVRLAAGDSTSWFVAFVGESDSARTWGAIHAAIDAYLTFFPRAAAAPAPRITAVQAAATSAPGAPARPAATLFFDRTAEDWVDPFLSELAEQLEAALPGSANGALVALNPWLPDSLRARAADNVAALELYKSCDGGRTFTADADCVGDPSVDPAGQPLGTGWRWYARFRPEDFGGDMPNTFTDSAVSGGRTYLYALVTRTRGAVFTLATPAGPRTDTLAAVRQSVLATGPGAAEAARVYIPFSREAGAQAARVRFTARPATATVPFAVQVTDSVQTGGYAAVFGNRLVVTRDSMRTSGTVTTRVQVQAVVPAAPSGTPTVVREQSFSRGDGSVLPAAGSPSSRSTITIGDTLRSQATYDALGFAVVTSAGEPVFVTIRLTGAAATPEEVFASAGSVGLLVQADQTVAGTYDAAGEVHLRATGDTVPRATVDAGLVQWREQHSVTNALLRTTALGRYELTWTAEPFGLPGGLGLNPANPPAVEAELVGALRARPAGSVGITGLEAAAIVGVFTDQLVPVRVPFTVRNTTFGRDVEVAMRPRADSTLLLGQAPDTVRVRVPADEWIPGDALVFVEPVETDSTVGGRVVLDGAGQPLRTTHRRVTFPAAVLGCEGPRPPHCNPVALGEPGFTGYLPAAPGARTRFHYYAGFRPGDEFSFEALAPVTGAQIVAVTAADLARIRVVPNPFILYAGFQPSYAEPRVLFTHMPPTGTLRLYTVSGQFLQQITWTPADLAGAGDLHVTLKSWEGVPLASGLYLWVLTAPSSPADPGSAPLRARGKLVIIR